MYVMTMGTKMAKCSTGATSKCYVIGLGSMHVMSELELQLAMLMVETPAPSHFMEGFLEETRVSTYNPGFKIESTSKAVWPLRYTF